MTYRVIYAPSFQKDIDQHIRYLIGQHVSIDRINRWYGELFERIDTLHQWPLRYPIDPIQTQAIGREIHKLNVGNYLVFYDVDQERKQVNVVAFIHGARYRGITDEG